MNHRVRNYLSKLERNSRICTAMFPLWAIPYTVYMFFVSLYLKGQGLTDIQIGNIMVVANVAALVCSVIGSPIVDRLGRRWSTSVFDIASSALPPLILFLSPTYPAAIVAMALTGMNRIMSVGYYLLMIEDTSEENSVVSMNMFNLILVFAGLVTPLAGLVVERMGLVSAERMFLLVSVISMTLLTTTRHLLLKETPTGLAIKNRLRSEKSGFSIIRLGREYAATFRYIFHDRRVFSAVLVNALIYVYYTVGTSTSLLFTPYFTDFLKVSSAQVGIVGGIYAVGTLLSMTLFNPRITRFNMSRYTAVACLGSMVGFLVLIIAPKGNLPVILAGVLITALSYGVLKTVADSLLAIDTSGEQRTGVYSFSFFFSSLLSIAAIKVCTALYSVFPGWLFIIAGILVLGILIDSLFRLRTDFTRRRA